jgi:hypothetical protein
LQFPENIPLLQRRTIERSYQGKIGKILYGPIPAFLMKNDELFRPEKDQ